DRAASGRGAPHRARGIEREPDCRWGESVSWSGFFGFGNGLGGPDDVVGPQLALERVETAGPDSAGFFEPSTEFVEAGGIEGLDTRLPLRAREDETRRPQHAQMLRDGRRADLELRHELAGRAFALGEQFDDTTTGGIGQGREAQ